MDAATAAEMSLYVDQFAAHSEQAKMRAAAAVAQVWGGFDGWYRDALVTEVAEQSADLSQQAQDTVAGLAEQYIGSVVAGLRHDRTLSIAPTQRQPVRNGADLPLVYARPAEMYREKIALGTDPGEALEMAQRRRDGLVYSDLLLAEREAQQRQMSAQKIERFRRIIRPELSQTGTCGLCIAASDQIYSSRDLMPIHAPSCKCKTMPIIGEDDPGRSLNQEDLDRLYTDAGSTKAEDLRRTRYNVNEHGEFGPVLTKVGDRHRGPNDVKPLEQDPERATRMLAKAEPALQALEARAAAGEDVSAPLAYQRELIRRLRRIAG